MTKVEQRRIVANYRLFTGEYVGGLLEVKQFRPLLPTIVFVLAAAVAFATGTSWGTMALLMPMVIELTYSALAGVRVSPDDPILLGTIGGVLAGAIFGDHCSPISDTTVLSAQASGCGLMEHVTTQLPYALSVGGVSILFGTLPVGFGAPAWLMLPLGVLAMAGLLLLFGRRAEDSSDGEQVDP